MSPSDLQHRRTHNILLISKLIRQGDASSPFTLVLDSLEQSAKPLVWEYLKRANASKVKCVYTAFETLKVPEDVEVFVPAWQESMGKWRSEVVRHLKAEPTRRTLLILDSLNPLCATDAANLPALLSSFIGPTTSLLAVYHTDISKLTRVEELYAPAPLTLLRYLATTVFAVYALHHVLARKAARERSRVEPSFGLEAGSDGVVQGLGSNGREGVVLEMEHRRKSGRGVREWYFLPFSDLRPSTAKAGSERRGEAMILLEDHPDYRAPEQDVAGEDDQAREDSTFELGLSERQRHAREGVVLPYFDAQKGGGDGGRILYDMGSEDDFDEEEDEI